MPEVTPSKYRVQAGWDDVPHLTEKAKREILDSTPPYLRSARSKGEPSLGAGAIYPINIDEILVDPFPIPVFWPRMYSLDVGWNRTAALWGGWDRETDTVYFYTEHYRGKAEPSIHAAAIKARGEWIPGVIDPAARGRAQKDGIQLLSEYRDAGLELTEAQNAVEAGLHRCWERLSQGRIKVFRTLSNFQAEYRLYRRDEDGKVIKEFDHLMDCMRYFMAMYKSIAIVEPVPHGGRMRTVGDETVGY